MSEVIGFDKIISKLNSVVKNAETVGDVVEKEATKMKDEAVRIAKSRGLEVTGKGIEGIVTKRQGTESLIGWAERPNLHLYFHEVGFHAGFGKHTSRESRGKRTRRYKKGSRKYVAPKPHVRPATLKLKNEVIRNIKNHILKGNK